MIGGGKDTVASRSIRQIILTHLKVNKHLETIVTKWLKANHATDTISSEKSSPVSVVKYNLLTYFQHHQKAVTKNIEGILKLGSKKEIESWVDLYPIEIEKRMEQRILSSHDASFEGLLNTVLLTKQDLIKLYETIIEESDIFEIKDLLANILQNEKSEFELFSRRISEFDQEFRSAM